jgi:AcrR family transcriptional regulator
MPTTTGNQSLGSGDRPALERLFDLFAALDEQLQPENGRGCPFFMAPAEIADESDPAHRHAVALKAWVNERFGELVREVTRPVVDPDQLADALDPDLRGFLRRLPRRSAADRPGVVPTSSRPCSSPSADGPAPSPPLSFFSRRRGL